MSKNIVYVCTDCGGETSKWTGQCPYCSAWNTLKEFKETPLPSQKKKGEVSTTQSFTRLKDTQHTEKELRISSGFYEFDRVLGGGFLSDMFVLLSGDPGIGKSTLVLQSAINIAKNHKVLYVSGEESFEQVRERANRLGISKEASENIVFSGDPVLENILETLKKTSVQFVVIDSIQTVFSESLPSVSGSVSQIRYCTEQIMHTVKQRGVACVLIGHVTKEGNMSGPQTLAHLVDTVLYFEGDPVNNLRLLRGQKNRFGTTSEVGIFEMDGNGLQEVQNPSSLFVQEKGKNSDGSVVTSIMEGSRPFLLEVQALTAWTQFGYPKRASTGFDVNRLHLLIAVLSKHAKMKLDSVDVFINIVGGMKTQERSLDLSVILALVSSKLQKPIPETMLVFGEVGLSGEIRSVPHIEKQLQEAERLGFVKAIVPASCKYSGKISLHKVSTIEQAIAKVFS
jgi:DNA repair protein RadA/Sms